MKPNPQRTARRLAVRTRRAAQRGQSMVEYIVVTAFAILVLIEGGNSSPVQQVVGAIKQAYRGFTFALGYATNLNIL
jgi:Flp pilus assembly pilin Flp